MEEFISTTYISKVKVEGYKLLKNATVNFLDGLNILIGKNGSGKSTFLEFANNLLTKNLNNLQTTPYKSTVEFVSIDDKFELKIEKSKKGLYTLANREERRKWEEHDILTSIIVKKNNKKINTEKFFKDSKDYKLVSNYDLQSSITLLLDSPIFINYDLPSEMNFLKVPGEVSFDGLDDSRFDNAYSDPDSVSDSFIESLFFPNVLNKDLKTVTNINDVFPFEENLKSNLNTYSPIKDIRLNPNFHKTTNETSVTWSFVFVEFYVNDQWLLWNQLSDGTKRLFYIIYSIYNAFESMVLLEEPELGIHPHQLHKLMDFIKAESEKRQIIISTHSPHVLDVLNENELDRIIVTKYEKGKGSQFYHLTEDQKNKAKDYIQEFGTISDYWLHSDLEEEEAWK